MEKEIIISGPEFVWKEHNGSIAETIIPQIKGLPKDHIVQVDAKNNESITSQDFLKMSLEVSEGLLEFGLKPGDVVVLTAPNSIRAHATLLGIIFSGAVAAPIDQNLKPVELQHILKIFQPKCIICLAEKAGLCESSAKAINLETKIVLIDSSRADSNSGLYTWDDIRTDVDVANYVPRKVSDPKKDLALICCSSGSTGLPKGVALSHYAILANNGLIRSTIFDEAETCILMTSPLFWISGIILFFVSCITGIPRYVPKSLSSEDILEAIEKYKPMFIILSPASVSFLVDHPNFKKTNVDSVKMIMVGGSTLGTFTAQKVLAIWKGVIFLQGYGMTEVAGGITISSETGNLMSVGKLLPGSQMKVVDIVTGKSLGPNKTGEARLKSKTFMNGYYNNKEETEAAFDENGWLRSGDLVYYDENEEIYIVGRIKEIIKYRNHQISPIEMESYIGALPGVQDVAIVPVPHETDSFHLKAVVVKSPESDITAEDIIQGVKENFSDAKHLRKGVQFVDVIPRTGTGKLKRVEINNMI